MGKEIDVDPVILEKLIDGMSRDLNGVIFRSWIHACDTLDMKYMYKNLPKKMIKRLKRKYKFEDIK